jgi:hypothetical protein
MKLGRTRFFRSGVCVIVLVGGTIALGAAPASAACGTSPGTNPIRVSPDPPLDPFGFVVPGIPEGMVQVCAEVEGDPAPQVDTDPTVDVRPTGCGVPCFVVEWDGVTMQPFTITAYGGVGPTDFFHQRTVDGGNYGGFCLNAGQSCPE